MKCLVVLTALLQGCSFGIVNQTTTLSETPFATVVMRGSVAEATQCVGRQWQAAAKAKGLTWNLSGWSVYTEAYRVRVTGPHGAGTPPDGLIIQFDDVRGQTFARAHVHRMFPQSDPRRVVTAQVLQTCKNV